MLRDNYNSQTLTKIGIIRLIYSYIHKHTHAYIHTHIRVIGGGRKRGLITLRYEGGGR